MYQATLDDSSLSSDGEVPNVVVVDDFGFDSLPPIEIKPASISPNLMRGPSAGPATAVPLRPGPIPPPSHSGVQSRGSRSATPAKNDNQQVLLGVGLAIAIMALLATVGVTVYTLLKPEKADPPVIRSMEDGNGGQVIILRE